MQIKRFFALAMTALLLLLTAYPAAAASQPEELYPEEFFWDKAGEDADNGYKAFDIPYGAALKIPDDPKREGSVFLGWKDWNTDAFVDLTQETMNAKGRKFYAAWEKEQYTFRFFVDGVLWTTTTGIPGEPFVHPRLPQKDGYTFAGWSPKLPSVTPAESMDFTAVFEPIQYIATLLVDGEVYQEIPYYYGQKSIQLPPVPKKDGYTGAWESYSLILGGVTIHAIYTPNEYIATLLVDGEVYKEIPYTYGQKSIQLPPVPKKDGYTGEWESYSLIIGGVTIHAIYTPIASPHTFRFFVFGQLLTTTTCNAGEAFIVPRSPERDGYTFAGWSPKLPSVTPDADMDFIATFSPNRYIAVLMVDGKVYKEIPYTYGQKSIALPDVPKKEGHFDAWESYSLVAGGVTIHAIYTPFRTKRTIGGDVDCDGKVNLLDVAVLERGLVDGWRTEINISNADVNGDSSLDLKDVVMIRRYLAGGWGVEIA